MGGVRAAEAGCWNCKTVPAAFCYIRGRCIVGSRRFSRQAVITAADRLAMTGSAGTMPGKSENIVYYGGTNVWETWKRKEQGQK